MPSRGVLFSLLALVIINTKMVRSAHGLPTPPATPPHPTDGTVVRVDSRCAQLGVSCLRRSSLPPLVPFIAGDIGYSSIQQASLLGAFFPCVPALSHTAGGVGELPAGCLLLLTPSLCWPGATC